MSKPEFRLLLAVFAGITIVEVFALWQGFNGETVKAYYAVAGVLGGRVLFSIRKRK